MSPVIMKLTKLVINLAKTTPKQSGAKSSRKNRGSANTTTQSFAGYLRQLSFHGDASFLIFGFALSLKKVAAESGRPTRLFTLNNQKSESKIRFIPSCDLVLFESRFRM